MSLKNVAIVLFAALSLVSIFLVVTQEYQWLRPEFGVDVFYARSNDSADGNDTFAPPVLTYEARSISDAPSLTPEANASLAPAHAAAVGRSRFPKRGSWVLRGDRGTVRNLTLCASNTAMYPGRLNAANDAWVPDACDLRYYDLKETAQCYRQKRFLVFGDSLTRPLFREMQEGNPYMRLKGKHKKKAHSDLSHKVYTPRHVSLPASNGSGSGHSGNYGLEWQRSNSFNTKNHKKAERVHPVYGMGDSIRKADVVILNGAMWDMGMTFCGVGAFYRGAKDVLRFVKEHARADAEVVVWPIHHTHRDRCPKTNLCYTCNHPRKASVFRRALALAASCVNVSSINTRPMSKEVPFFTKDGAHFHAPYTLLENDVFMNAFCRDPPMKPVAPVACSPEIEAASLREWSLVEEARVGCLGHNHTENCEAGVSYE